MILREQDKKLIGIKLTRKYHKDRVGVMMNSLNIKLLESNFQEKNY